MVYETVRLVRATYIKELKFLVEAMEKENEKLFPEFERLCLNVEVCATGIKDAELLRTSTLDKMLNFSTFV